MPILIDGSQFLVSSLMSQIKFAKDVNEELVRHILLNSIRQNRVKFVKEYGEVVFCMDSKDHWRKDIFKYYKANRKKNRDASSLDWKEIFRIFSVIQTELAEIFPYKFVKVPRCEGDDVIATICKFSNSNEKILILSSDKDFRQLHKYPNVKQYDPIKKQWVKESDPELYLREHIIRGDSGDGVPNMLSADDVLVTEGKRQKPVTEKSIKDWLSVSEDEFYNNLTEDQKINYTRNKLLIDLNKIPEDFEEQIIEEYRKPIKGHRTKILNYFIKNRMKALTECLGDF